MASSLKNPFYSLADALGCTLKVTPNDTLAMSGSQKITLGYGMPVDVPLRIVSSLVTKTQAIALCTTMGQLGLLAVAGDVGRPDFLTLYMVNLKGFDYEGRFEREGWKTDSEVLAALAPHLVQAYAFKNTGWKKIG